MALPNDMSRMADAVAKLEGGSAEYSSEANKKTAARTLIRRTFSFPTTSVLANGSDAVLSNAGPAVRMMSDGRVLGAYFICKGDITAAGPANATLAVHKTDGTGNVGVAVASITTNTSGANGGTGNIVNGQNVALTVTDLANARFSKGYNLAPAISQNGDGVVVPAGTIQVDVELEGAATDYGNPR